jgi:hypothetical protein
MCAEIRPIARCANAMGSPAIGSPTGGPDDRCRDGGRCLALRIGRLAVLDDDHPRLIARRHAVEVVVGDTPCAASRQPTPPFGTSPPRRGVYQNLVGDRYGRPFGWSRSECASAGSGCARDRRKCARSPNPQALSKHLGAKPPSRSSLLRSRAVMRPASERRRRGVNVCSLPGRGGAIARPSLELRPALVVSLRRVGIVLRLAS